jgi:curved DNA-binding protein CbpA
MKNSYEVLGVPEDADDDQIRKVQRHAAKMWHPDRPGATLDDAAQLVKANEAAQVLLNPALRKLLDDSLAAEAAAAKPPPPTPVATPSGPLPIMADLFASNPIADLVHAAMGNRSPSGFWEHALRVAAQGADFAWKMKLAETVAKASRPAQARLSDPLRPRRPKKSRLRGPRPVWPNRRAGRG